MNRIIVILSAVVASLFATSASLAQTTTFGESGFPCADGSNGYTITVTGSGLSLSSNSPIFTNLFCVANVGKYGKTNYNSGAGLFYYTFTPSGSVSQQAYGFSSSPVFSLNSASSTNFLGGSWGIGYGTAIWILSTKVVASVPAPTNGVKGAIVVNLNTDPWQFWATNDVTATGLVCDGSGHSGSTHPMWNGNCTSDPSLVGTSSLYVPIYPFDGTGVPFYMSSSQVFPAVTLGHNDTTTFSFADDAAVDALLPAGYRAWNDNTGSTCSFPCPQDTVTYNVANAPGWSAGATLHKGSRVLAGPGWTPGSPGHFNNGQAIYLWAAPGPGGGTIPGSASVSFNTCPTPANVGGGLDGSIPASWNPATHFTDANNNTWYCLSQIQYPNLTAIAFDTEKNWSHSTGTCSGNDHRPGCYWMLDEIINNGKVYNLPTGGGAKSCQSDTSPTAIGPTGTASPIIDGSCLWWYVGTQLYSPQTYLWPLEQMPATTPDASVELRYNWVINVNVYYGGSDSPIYQAGANGEGSPLQVGAHAGFVAESPVFCPGGFASAADPSNSGYFGYCTGLYARPRITVPPGDSFVDNINPATDPLRIDDTKGVELYSNGSGVPAYLSYDNIVQMDRFQIKSETGMGYRGCCNETNPELFANAIILQQNIIDGGSAATLAVDAGSEIMNNVIIWHGNVSGGAAIFFKFGSDPVTYNTIVCTPGITDSAGFFLGNAIGGGDFGSNPPFIGNLVLGCAVPYAFSTEILSPWTNNNNYNNATDVTSVSGAPITAAFNGGTRWQRAMLNGLTGITPSNQLVNPTLGSSFDARIKGTSANIYGAGVNFSYVMGGFYGTDVPGPDVLNTVRPTSGRYDIGAEQFVPGGTPP